MMCPGVNLGGGTLAKVLFHTRLFTGEIARAGAMANGCDGCTKAVNTRKVQHPGRMAVVVETQQGVAGSRSHRGI